MKKTDKKPSAPTSCSRAGKVERKKPDRSGATRHSRGPCRYCSGIGYFTHACLNWTRMECTRCQGTGRANDGTHAPRKEKL